MTASSLLYQDFLRPAKASARDGAQEENVEVMLARARGQARAEGFEEGLAQAEARFDAEAQAQIAAVAQAIEAARLEAAGRTDAQIASLRGVMGTVLKALAPRLAASNLIDEVIEAVATAARAAPDETIVIETSPDRRDAVEAALGSVASGCVVEAASDLNATEARVNWRGGFDAVDAMAAANAAIETLDQRLAAAEEAAKASPPADAPTLTPTAESFADGVEPSEPAAEDPFAEVGELEELAAPQTIAPEAVGGDFADLSAEEDPSAATELEGMEQVDVGDRLKTEMSELGEVNTLERSEGDEAPAGADTPARSLEEHASEGAVLADAPLETAPASDLEAFHATDAGADEIASLDVPAQADDEEEQAEAAEADAAVTAPSDFEVDLPEHATSLEPDAPMEHGDAFVAERGSVELNPHEDAPVLGDAVDPFKAGDEAATPLNRQPAMDPEHQPGTFDLDTDAFATEENEEFENAETAAVYDGAQNAEPMAADAAAMNSGAPAMDGDIADSNLSDDGFSPFESNESAPAIEHDDGEPDEFEPPAFDAFEEPSSSMADFADAPGNTESASQPSDDATAVNEGEAGHLAAHGPAPGHDDQIAPAHMTGDDPTTDAEANDNADADAALGASFELPALDGLGGDDFEAAPNFDLLAGEPFAETDE